MSDTPHRPGHFVWYELMSSDPARSAAWYTELFGWTVAEMEIPDGVYRVLREGEDGIAGITRSPADSPMPDHWLGYISAEPDSVAARTRAFEGQVLVPPMDMPEVGRLTVVLDPQGASIAAFKGVSGDPPVKTPIPVGRFCWSHLHSTDVIGSQSFYQMAFPLAAKPRDDGSMLLTAKPDGAEVATVAQAPADTPASWLHYVIVSDLEASTARAVELGASVVHANQKYEGYGTGTVIADPTGAVLALFQPQGS
ncbi:MAG: VOC family protein [Deltaproteobacteria bacterium]|nr:VOC family protein [Deltaproteobacteria bacterium]